MTTERRRVVEQIKVAAGVSERCAIRYAGFSRSSMRYKSLREPQTELRARIKEMAEERPRWGYRQIPTRCCGGRVGG